MRRLCVATIALLLAMSTSVVAGDVRVLSVGSVQVATKALADDFARQTGHKVIFTIVSPNLIEGRLKSAPYDMLIASVAAVETAEKTGLVRQGSRAPLARAGIGVMVRDGGPVPDVSTPEAFKAAVLAARSIVHGDPALPNQSGVVTMRILAKAGILDAVRPKARAAALADGFAMVAKGEVELALFNLVELPHGVRLAGPVPAPWQDYTFYEAAVLANRAMPNEAQAFIALLTSQAARGTWEAAMLDAYPYR